MALEQHFNEDRTNIRILSLEAPKKENDEIVTEEDLKWLDHEFSTQHVYKGLNWELMNAKILAPEYFEHIHFDEQEAGDTISVMESQKKQGDLFSYFQYASNLKIMNPEAFKASFDEREAAQKMVDELNNLDRPWGDYAYAAANLVIASPESRKSLVLDAAFLQQLRDLLNSYRKNITEYNNLVDFALLATDLRIAFGDKFPEIKLNEDILQQMKQKLKEHRREKDSVSFLKRAVQIKILSAEKVEVTENGLKLTMPTAESFKQEFRIPAKRKF